jgi:uncharacterized protein (DUF1778 family)
MPAPHAQTKHPRRERLEVRCTPEQKELLQHAARLQGQTLSDFLLGSAARAAEQAIREYEVMTLSARDSRSFVEALLNPPPPAERLRRASAHYDDAIGSR